MDADDDEHGVRGALPDITADDIHGSHSDGDDEGAAPADEETEAVRSWTVEVGGEKFDASIGLSSGLTVQRDGAAPDEQIDWQKAERQQFRAQLDRVMDIAKDEKVLDSVDANGLDKS